MSFTKAFQKALKEQGQNIEVPEIIETDPQLVPHMYRAQVQPRCSLQFAGDRTHRDIWIEQWVNPRKEDGKPTYQYAEAKDVLEEGYFFRFQVEFPYRLFSNCGQDSIFRPMLGKNGIPFIPGSGVKGVFLRYCKKSDPALAIRYCGDKEPVTQGILRFHGAYPVGDWAGTMSREDKATHYRLVDVVHPQENRQIGIDEKSTSAFALISFYQPKLVFEISSTELLSQEEWRNISMKLKSALRQGLGGKTSTGYGLPFITKNQYNINLSLHGVGITPVLLTGEPEFRPNVFKATLRGHAKRLLGGCCQNQQDDKRVERKIGELFGNTQAPGKVEIYWELRNPLPKTDWQSTYDIRGDLHISAPDTDVEFLKCLIKFAYTMGGFGKSWRRVWHKDFYNNLHYDKLIGCYWKCEDSNWKKDISEWINDIKTQKQLGEFLKNLENVCKNYFQVKEPQFLNWREAWHKKRVAVYSQIVSQSQVIELFHNEIYKQTQAIGGRKTITRLKNGREEETEVLVVSSVWHRMLPIDNDQYLEIVTVFHGDRRQWQHKSQDDQLQPFIKNLKDRGLQLSWGQEPK